MSMNDARLPLPFVRDRFLLRIGHRLTESRYLLLVERWCLDGDMT